MSIAFVAPLREVRSQGKSPAQNLERLVYPERYDWRSSSLEEEQWETQTGQNTLR